MYVSRNIYLNNITESVYTNTATSSFTHDYMANGSTILLTGNFTANFTISITNVPSLTIASSYGRACVVTLIITGTGKFYCNAVNITPIGGSSTGATVYYNGGSSISISSSTVTVQQLAIYNNGSYIVLSNVSSFYA